MIDESAYMRLAKWALTDDTGVSSKAIGAKWLGMEPRYGWGYPHDSGDFGRCYRLLQAIPQIDIAIMRDCNPAWARLVERWQELTALYEAGSAENGWRGFYEVIQSIIRTPTPGA